MEQLIFRTNRWGDRWPQKKYPFMLLTKQNWNDYGYYTLFELTFIDSDGIPISIGNVKIGRIGGSNSTELPDRFTGLDEEYFSLGIGESYYEKLNSLGDIIKYDLLKALRDISLNQDIYNEVIQLEVTKVSLLRSTSPLTIKGQYRRIISGLPKLTNYSFKYHSTNSNTQRKSGYNLSFHVNHGRNPPSNIHVVIGSNGVGKSMLLHEMSEVLVNHLSEVNADGNQIKDDSYKIGGRFEDTSDVNTQEIFAGLAYVSFSAFDNYRPISNGFNAKGGIKYAYIGLKRPEKSGRYAERAKSSEMLASEFAKSLFFCSHGSRPMLWKRIIAFLNADPIFKDAGTEAVLDNANTQYSLTQASSVTKRDSGNDVPPEFQKRAEALFNTLSSGHKIVLLTLTRLVEVVEERTIVLMDEPETHLHPPLLAAFVRALSELLIDRNGVAIIATHSPVILQEVPKRCVWILNRYGDGMVPRRPPRETFGENVGVLTRDVFQLQATQTGFHQLIKKTIAEVIAEAKATQIDYQQDEITDLISKQQLYDRVIEEFNEELGDEARSIIRALTYSGEQND